jgi:hypothetical protein
VGARATLKVSGAFGDKSIDGRGSRVLPGVTLFCMGAGCSEASMPGAVAAGLVTQWRQQAGRR